MGGSIQVWIGILPSSGVLLVWEIPWRRYFFRSPARSLPIVAGLIWRSSRRVSPSRWRCPCSFLVLHEEQHASCQTNRYQEGAGCPDCGECLLDERAIPGRTVPVDMLRGICDQDTLSQEIPLSGLMQNPGGMSPAVSRLLTEIVQHHRLLGLPCLQIRLCLDHREHHPRCSFLIQRTNSILSSFTSFSYDGGVLFQVVWVRGMGRSYVHESNERSS